MSSLSRERRRSTGKSARSGMPRATPPPKSDASGRTAQVLGSAGSRLHMRWSGRFTALFGFPQADEHSAEQAVRAGLALIKEVRGPETIPPERFATRVGIA